MRDGLSHLMLGARGLYASHFPGVCQVKRNISARRKPTSLAHSRGHGFILRQPACYTSLPLKVAFGLEYPT